MIIFNASKRETHHAKGSFSLLANRLQGSGKVKVKVNRKDLSADLLKDCDVIIFGNSQVALSGEELRVLRDYIDGGGSLAIFASEGGESRTKSNINELLKDYGIRIDSSTVVRSVYHKYFHPKHALITNGIVQPELGQVLPLVLDSSTALESGSNRPQEHDVKPSTSLSFVYPNGTTLVVQSPSFTLLSSGSTSYPVDCPIAAAWEGDIASCRPSPKKRQGRLVVLGSADIFANEWIEKEENCSLCDVLFRFLRHQKITFDPSLGRADFEDREVVPDISSLANLVKACVQEDEPLPQDYKSLLIDNLVGMRMDNIPDVLDLYKRLNVPYEPLTLVEPHFEIPQPPLRLAIHEPKMITPSPPALELFDLDESFMDVRIRLHKLSSKFHEDKDLTVFVEEAGLLVVPGVYHDEGWRSHGVQLSKYLLYRVAKKLFECKTQSGITPQTVEVNNYLQSAF